MNRNNQKGYMRVSGWGCFLISMMLVSAVVGWGLIEGLIWVFSHITIGWA